jgi:hypothetical protein
MTEQQLDGRGLIYSDVAGIFYTRSQPCEAPIKIALSARLQASNNSITTERTFMKFNIGEFY